jgi:hypothetical protein
MDRRRDVPSLPSHSVALVAVHLPMLAYRCTTGALTHPHTSSGFKDKLQQLACPLPHTIFFDMLNVPARQQCPCVDVAHEELI